MSGDDLDRTLRRQLARLGLDPTTRPPDDHTWATFVDRINHAYINHRRDSYVLQRSLATVSQEMADLNEQIRASAEIDVAVERARLEAVISALSDGFCATDISGRAVTVNPAAAQILGDVAPGEDVLARFSPGVASVAPNDASDGPDMGRSWGLAPEQFTTLHEGHPVRDDTALVRARDGSHLPVSLLVFPIARHGLITGLGVLFRDTSEAAAVEEARRAQALSVLVRAECQAEMHRPGDLLGRIDATLGALASTLQTEGRIQWTAALRLHETPEAPVVVVTQGLAAPWIEPVTTALGFPMERVAETRIEPLADGGGTACIIPLTSETGTTGHLVTVARPATVVGEPLLRAMEATAEMIGVAVAETRAHQAVDAARRVAEEATRAKSQFLANMSHEIRTPMNGVLGMLDMLSATSLDAGQRDYVEVAQSSAETMMAVIDDILDFSKIEAGKVTLETVAFDVRAATEEVTALYGAQANRKGLELCCFIPSDLPTRVRGDPTRVRQVLANLVGNAIKFTADGEVAVNLVRLRQRGRQVTYRFTVADTGIGMSEATRAGLFDSFSQGDTSTTRRFGGTGLGLAISHQLVELMGGSVHVDSEPGAGTIFTVDIPFELEPQARSALPTLDLEDSSRVLIVDDNETNRFVMSHYLTSFGVPHDIATDGEDGWIRLRDAEAEGHPYALAIIDMQMPRLDGAGLIARIRADSRVRRMRLVLASSAGSAGLGSTADAVLTKPLRLAVVHSVLADLLARDGAPADATGRDGKDVIPTAGSLEGLPVLLVEDNPVNQRVGAGMLERLGAVVTVAPDGKQGAHAMAEDDFAIVLMDCQMPVMDGFDATREARRHEAQTGRPRTPIIALTADVIPQTRRACVAAGMDDFLAKPYTIAALAEVVRRWVPATPVS